MKTNSIGYSVYPYNVEIHVLGCFFFHFWYCFFDSFLFSFAFYFFFELSLVSRWLCWVNHPFSPACLPFPASSRLPGFGLIVPFLGCRRIFTFSFCFLHCLCCYLWPFSVWSVLVLCGKGFPQMPVGHEFLAHGWGPKAFYKVICLISVVSSRCPCI